MTTEGAKGLAEEVRMEPRMGSTSRAQRGGPSHGIGREGFR